MKKVQLNEKLQLNKMVVSELNTVAGGGVKARTSVYYRCETDSQTEYCGPDVTEKTATQVGPATNTKP